MVLRFGKVLLLRLVLPILWVIVTMYVSIDHRADVVAWYGDYPVAVIVIIMVWIVIPGAYFPLSQTMYTRGSVVIVGGGSLIACIVSGVDMLNKTFLIWGGGTFVGFAFAWLAGLGTHWWRLCQGKLSVDDPDT